MGKAAAQTSTAILPVDYGQGSARSVCEDLTAAFRSSSTNPSEIIIGPNPFLGIRYGIPEEVDLQWVSLEVVRGENAYFESRPEEAVAILEQERLVELWDATVEMADRPEFASIIRRGMLALARVYFHQGDTERSTAVIRESLRRFPTWLPAMDWYHPDFVEHYNQIRDECVFELPTLRVRTPSSDCAVQFNGQEIGTGEQVEVPIARGNHAVTVQCERQRSRIHIVSLQNQRELTIDPEFDEVWAHQRGVLVVGPEPSRDPPLLSSLARVYADLVNADSVIMVGWIDAPHIGRMIQVARFENTADAFSRAFRVPSGTDVEVLVAALRTSDPIEGVQYYTPTGWSPFRRDDRDRSRTIAGWCALGVGSAALILGTVFAFVEDDEYIAFVDCDADPVCRNSDALADHQRAGERATVASFIGFGVALAALTTGALLLLLNSNGPQTGRSEPQTGGFRIDGGSLVGVDIDPYKIGLTWQF